MKIMRTALRVFDYVIGGFAYIAGALSLLMMLGVSADIVGRYFVNRPISGMIEANQIAIPWVVFLASAYVTKKRGQISMDVIVQSLKPKARNLLNFCTYLVSTCACLGLFWYSLTVTIGFFQDKTMETGNIIINSGFLMMALPVGSLALGIQFSRLTYGYWKGFMEPASISRGKEAATE
jgi:TRAP-type C4-dicarboxylate transport system permease small subunit